MSASTEQRKSKRYGCYVPVEGKTDGIFAETQTVNISKDGIGFVSSHAIPVNEKIAIELTLQDDEPVVVLGVVKWSTRIGDTEQYRIGMTFEEVLSGSRRELTKYLQKSTSFQEVL
jgi:hypothetical protein